MTVDIIIDACSGKIAAPVDYVPCERSPTFCAMRLTSRTDTVQDMVFAPAGAGSRRFDSTGGIAAGAVAAAIVGTFSSLFLPLGRLPGLQDEAYEAAIRQHAAAAPACVVVACGCFQLQELRFRTVSLLAGLTFV